MKNHAIPEESGYLEYFGLKHNPFPVAPDDENFYVSEHIEQILVEIVHGVMSRKGFMVLTGDIGLGKTTISRRIISILEAKGVETSLVFQTAHQDAALLNEINRDFGLKRANLNLGELLELLNDFLLEQTRAGKNCAIVIDDAQNLNHKSLELVRMISNLEANQQKLVQILLIGQPELMDMLNSKELRQLKSRIIIRKEAMPLSVPELKNYITFKLNLAGNNGTTTIKKSAIARLHSFSKGNLRLSNIIMDRSLCVAFLYNTRKIDRKIVNEAFYDLEPKKSVFSKKTAVLCMALLLLLILWAGFFYNSQYSRPLSAAHNVVRKKINTRIPPVSDRQPAPQAELNQVALKVSEKRAGQSTDIPGPVSDFMAAYQLAEFSEEFFKSLTQDRFEEVGEIIFGEKGYQLIQLEELPDYINEKYDILAYPHGKNKKERYYLFWHPELKVPVFYYSYQGEEIRALQRKLAKFSLYNDTLDGSVGKNLMKAVIAFQKKAGLPVSGVPDNRTLFYLYSQAENSYQ